jgi:valyl-tRNA synthetase
MMRQSKGNVINPLDLIEKFGTDAFRMSLVVGNTPGTSLALSEDKIKAYKHFANKLWNISRFVFENNPEISSDEILAKEDTENATYIKEFEDLVTDITADMENYRFYLAAEKIYHYTWHTFADIILEQSKIKLKDETKAESTRNMLGWLLRQQLKILHPFMPFITEKIWSFIPKKDNLLIVESWPHKN